VRGQAVHLAPRLASLIAKMWRLRLMCSVYTHKKVDVSEQNALNLFYFGFVCVLFYLVLLTSIDPPVMTQPTTVSARGQETLISECKSTTVAMEYALIAIEASPPWTCPIESTRPTSTSTVRNYIYYIFVPCR
jgi:hypothetical protein